MSVEDLFPTKEIKLIAQIETQRRQFYRPIYSIHKSWARRPGSPLRALGIAHFLNKPPFTNSKIPEEQDFYKKQNFQGKILLDPFCGGGTTLTEFNRLGLKTIGIDINPISLFTTKLELTDFNRIQFDEEVKKLTSRVGNTILSFYKTKCDVCNNLEASIMYTFWVRTIICPKCHSNEALFKYYIIGVEKRKSSTVMIICPSCEQLFYTNKKLDIMIKCPSCNQSFVPRKGNCQNKNFICKTCHAEYRLLEVIKDFQTSMGTRQIAIEYYCSECKTRGYKAITKEDIVNYQKIYDRFLELSDELLIPKQNLPTHGYNIENLKNYGFQKFTDLFNSRQLLSLGLLANEILKIENINVREYLIAAFSSSLEFHTTLCPYNYTMKQIVNIFNYQSFLVPTIFVENNVWGVEKGNGTFITYLDRIRKAKDYCKHPFEIFFKEGKIIKYKIPKESILANTSSSFDDLIGNDERNTLLLCGTSEDLQQYGLPDNSIDLIVTDPPYYDYIQYSELSNFFYVWLRLFLYPKYSDFKSEIIMSDQEVGVEKNADLFLEKLTKVFKECNRVLKDDAPFIFTFHHSSELAWELILKSVNNGNFYISTVYSVHSEFGARPIKSQDVDFFLFCRKKDFNGDSNKLSSLNQVLLIELVKKNFNFINPLSQSEWEEKFSQLLPLISQSLIIEPNIDLKLVLQQIFTNYPKKLSKDVI